MKWLGKNGVVEGGSSLEDVIINAILSYAAYLMRSYEFTREEKVGIYINLWPLNAPLLC